MKDCNQCGKCCTNYGGGDLSATAAEVDHWEDARPDIARYVRDGRIWIDPETGETLKRCPWLQQLPGQTKFICQIYDERPEDCRYYPVHIADMVKDECEMLEQRDLDDLRRAQRKLDALMADSRPAFSTD